MPGPAFVVDGVCICRACGDARTPGRLAGHPPVLDEPGDPSAMRRTGDVRVAALAARFAAGGTTDPPCSDMVSRGKRKIKACAVNPGSEPGLRYHKIMAMLFAKKHYNTHSLLCVVSPLVHTATARGLLVAVGFTADDDWFRL